MLCIMSVTNNRKSATVYVLMKLQLNIDQSLWCVSHEYYATQGAGPSHILATDDKARQCTILHLNTISASP